MGNFIYTVTLIGLLSCFSCSKIKEDCTEKGEFATFSRKAESFNQIVANNRLVIELVQDSLRHGEILVSGPSNLLDGVRFEVVNKQLSITNKNRCKWLRELKTRVHCKVFVKDLIEIEAQGDASFISHDTLQFSTLTIDHRSTAKQQLILNIGTLFIDHREAGEIVLSGHCAVFVPTIYETGKLSTQRFSAKDVFIYHYGLNRADVNATNKLECIIENQGSVYYHSNPLNPIVIKGKGKGEVKRAL